jgi:hypothetical protein
MILTFPTAIIQSATEHHELRQLFFSPRSKVHPWVPYIHIYLTKHYATSTAKPRFFWKEKYFFFFVGSPRLWTHAFTLVRQALYHLSHSSKPFCSGSFEHSVSVFPQAGLDFNPMLHFPPLLGWQKHTTPLSFYLLSFCCTGLEPQFSNLITASPVSEMTSPCHNPQLLVEMGS